MRHLPLDSCLARGKEMPVVADVLPHIGAAPRRDINNERDLSFSWVQVEHLFGCDRKLNVACGDRTARGDLSGEVQLHKDAARVPLALAIRWKRRCKQIGIAIGLLQTLTAPSRNIFHSPMLGLHIKNTSRSH